MCHIEGTIQGDDIDKRKIVHAIEQSGQIW